jgi:uncharacterized protein with beta-barrel porin domain
VWVWSGGDVNAGGDGVVGQSIAIASLQINQNADQNNNGVTGPPSNVWTPLNSGNTATASAGPVTVTSLGTVVAGGTGVVGMSYAYAGTAVGSSATSGAVTVEVYDDVTAGKTGIYAGSIAETDAGPGTQGNVTVAVKGGTTIGGSGFYGIEVAGGDINTITIAEQAGVTSQSAQAILGGAGDETVHNSGWVAGDVDLNGGSNAFFNYASATFYSGDVLDLNGGPFQNAGLLSPGGPGVIKTTELNGSFAQTSSGTYEVDVDMGNAKADLVNATGPASLGGDVKPDIIANPVAGTQVVTILQASGVTNDDPSVVDESALADYALLFNPNSVVLSATVDFAPDGLAREQDSVGQHLNKVFAGGGPSNMDELGVALIRLPTVSEVGNAYAQLTGENFRALPIATLYSAETFSSDMMSCPDRGDGSAHAFIAENQCLWARARFRTLDYDANAATTGFDEDAIAVSGGAQWALNGPWYAGVALGYENSDIHTEWARINSDGDRFHGGASLKYINGPWLLAGAVAGGGSWYDSSRWITFPGFSSVAKSEQDIFDVGGQFRAAYQAGHGPWYAKPMVDLNVTHVDLDNFTEKGGSGAALRVSGSDETVFSATPALEVGRQMALKGGTLVRPYVRGGVSFYSDADFPLRAGFAAAPGVTPFTTRGEIDDVLGNVSAGITLLGVRGGVLSFSYDGSFGENLEEHSASAKASMRF